MPIVRSRDNHEYCEGGGGVEAYWAANYWGFNTGN